MDPNNFDRHIELEVFGRQSLSCFVGDLLGNLDIDDRLWGFWYLIPLSYNNRRTLYFIFIPLHTMTVL